MNKYDEYYDFRMAKISDVDAIMSFIHNEWKKNHILAKNKNFFLWQYGRTEYNDYDNINYILMLSKNGEIIGGQGFIVYSNDINNIQVSGSMIKVKTQGVLPMSGVELMRRGHSLLNVKLEFASGANPKTILPIYKNVFKYKTGVMQQYYMINPNIKEFSIAKIHETKIHKIKDFRFHLLSCNDFFELKSIVNLDKDFPHMSKKSCEFIKKRYFNHPSYHYEKWIVFDNYDIPVGLLIGRIVCVNNSKILRIVDFRGDINDFYRCGFALFEIMCYGQYEYIDVMVDELSFQDMKNMGFELLNPDGNIIIPNYFEPFIQENIKNYYEKNGDVIIFKADGDQDRPNL